MTTDNIYEAQDLTPDLYKIFAGVYSDFRVAAINEYKFELEPLSYEDFINSIEKGLIKCIVLLENKIPTAFLVYTTLISEAIELNVIHCLGDEDLLSKRKLLLEKFLEETEELRKEKIICYPMIGSQGDFTADIAHYGFKFVGLAVLRFIMENTSSKTILKALSLPELDANFEIKPWAAEYIEDAIEIIQRNFSNTSDALFDPRFKSIEGTRDILDKITTDIYGDFLPESTSVLFYAGKPCGFCLTNLTGGRIANIPLFAIDKPFQGKGLSKYLLKNSVEKLLELSETGARDISEVNTTTETNNFQALKMYRDIGFKEDYSYPQSYTVL
jgi:ribosomal protein S18 acetylase RimI-like enzyme